MRILAFFAALVVPLAACGGSGSGGASTELHITVWPGGRSGPSTTRTVRCPGDPICGRVGRLPLQAFDPVPADMACTQIYGGPDEARVQGTLRGQPVDSSFKRTDGCEIARWATVAFLLGRGG